MSIYEQDFFMIDRELQDDDFDKLYPVNFSQEEFDLYGFKYPKQSDFRENGHRFLVQEIILSNVSGSFAKKTPMVLGMIIITDGRTTEPESAFWSLQTGNCGISVYKIHKEK